MSDDFNHRFTHCLLIAVLVVMTRDDGWYGLHAPLLITCAFAWASGYPRLRKWMERRWA